MTIDPRAHPSVRAWLASGRKTMRCDGREMAAASGQTIDVIDPAAESPIASVPDANAADVATAVDAAAREFDRGTWPRASTAERERVLLALAAAIETHADELQHLIVLENGKLLSAARREVDGCVRFVRYAAGWATKITGHTLDVGTASAPNGVFAYTRREPVGVVAGIIPWNMPLAMAAWKSVPALMCGCTVVLKPSEEAPLSTLRLAELAYEAGLPPAALEHRHRRRRGRPCARGASRRGQDRVHWIDGRRPRDLHARGRPARPCVTGTRRQIARGRVSRRGLGTDRESGRRRHLLQPGTSLRCRIAAVCRTCGLRRIRR